MELLAFRPVRVFDLAQTEGEAQLATNPFADKDQHDALARLMEFASTQEFQVEYSDQIAPARGTSYRGVIRLLICSRGDGFCLARELAVQMLCQTERRSFVMWDVLLREAKAVAFVVDGALGENRRLWVVERRFLGRLGARGFQRTLEPQITSSRVA